MMRNKTTGRLNRKGVVAVMVAIAIIGVLGVVAIAIDGGCLLERRRHAQATADAAAMAAACSLYQRFPTDRGQDPSGFASAAALTTASANDFSNNGSDSSVTVHIPPTSGIYAGKAGYAEVLVTYYQPRYFSRIWGADKLQVKARAVSRGSWTPSGIGVIVLDYTGKAALNGQGNGAFTETSGPVIVNSNNTSAVVDGGNGYLKANEFFITGGATTNGNAQLVTDPVPNLVHVGVHPTPDPLAYLPQPSAPANGTMDTKSIGKGNKQYTLTPGRYTNLPTFNPGDVVILKQASANGNGGVYYIDGGGFKSTGATITMDTGTTGGVMIYNHPTSTAQTEKIQITGNSSGTVSIGPLTDGPYAGMTLWQDRTSPVSMLVEGNGSFNMSGTFYAAGALLNVAGNGGTNFDENGNTVSGSQIGSQYVVKDLSVSGNGNVALRYPGKRARERVLTLVE